MKIPRTMAMFVACGLIGFFAVETGCGSGQFIDKQAPQVDQSMPTDTQAPVSVAPVSEAPGVITAPEVVAVTAEVEVKKEPTPDGEEKIDKGLPCILNYPPESADVIGYMSGGAEVMLDKLGLGKLKDDEELLREAFFYIEAAVIFGKSDNEMKDAAVLVRLKSDIDADFDGFMTQALDKMNKDSVDAGETDLVRYQKLDEGTGILSKSDKAIAEVLSRVEGGTIFQDACVFYRVDRGAAVTTPPVAYAMAKGAAAVKLGESIFPNEIENLKQSLQESMMIGGLNLDDGGKILMYVAMLDSDQAATAKPITYFSAFLDSDNALAADLLKLFSEKALEGGFDGEEKEMDEMKENLDQLEAQYDKLIKERDEIVKMMDDATTEAEKVDFELKLKDVDVEIERIEKEINDLKEKMPQQ